MGTRDGVYVAGRWRFLSPNSSRNIGVGKIPFGGNYGANPGKGYENFSSAVMTNAKNNFMTMGTSLILIPIGFTLAIPIDQKTKGKCK
jgi:hypothetical protein